MEFVCRFCEKSDFKRRGGLSRHLRKCALKYEAQLRREGKLNRRKWPSSAAGLSADQSEPFHELDILTAGDSRPSGDEPVIPLAWVLPITTSPYFQRTLSRTPSFPSAICPPEFVD